MFFLFSPPPKFNSHNIINLIEAKIKNIYFITEMRMENQDLVLQKDIYKDFWIFSQQCRCIENKSSELEVTKNLLTKSIKLDYPLSLYLKVIRNPDRVEWLFGPYTTGSYEVLLPDSYGAIKFQKEGSLKIQIDPTKDISIILKYTDPTGWSTYSPLLKVGVFTPVQEWKR
jgi:hypothetical protein